MENNKKDNETEHNAKEESSTSPERVSGKSKGTCQTNELASKISTKTGAASTSNALNAKEGNLPFGRKLNLLQEKTKNLRRKLGRGFGSKRIKQQEELVGTSEETRGENDVQASLFMRKLGASILSSGPPSEVISLTSNGANGPIAIINNRKDVDTSSSCSMELMKALPKLHSNREQKPQQAQNPSKKKEKRKTRRELEEQLQNMRDLFSQLTLQNPQIETKMRQLIVNNEKFKALNMFTPSAEAGKWICMQTANDRTVPARDHQATSKLLSKQRQDSLTSNTSSISSLQSGMGPSTSKKGEKAKSEEDNNKKERKKKRGKKAKKSKAKTQQSEQEALQKYLKMIVEEFLDSKDADKIAECTYKPDEEDLETYAQRLIKADLGHIVEEEIRINRKNNRQSFVVISSDREDLKRDAIILAPVARHYAFEGDIVRAFVMHSALSAGNSEAEDKARRETVTAAVAEGNKDHSLSEEEDPFDGTESPESDADPNELDSSLVSAPEGCPKAFVIKIIAQTEKREVVGTISFKNFVQLNDGQSYYKLKPHDMRMPMIFVPVATCEANVTPEQRNDICGFLYVVKVREVNAHGVCIGDLHHPVGRVGNIEAEIRAILLHNRLKDVCPYEERFNRLFAEPDPPITSRDLQQRVDLRKKCIFTIDPLTARDLDDAVSIDAVNDDLYEVGVHISDVAHYLQEDTELDNIVKDRATSIYLVNEVIHMLPQPLCFKCSLLPGEDKFAFSVFWRIKLNGEIVDSPRFARSVINSCTQFAYEHAQKIIDNPEEEFDNNELPSIHNGFSAADIASRVHLLRTIAQSLRAKRFEGGALSLNNPKLRFTMDPQTGEPISYEVEERQEANFLIEEFMLLANQSVAQFIHSHFPEVAILRHHPPPLAKSLKSLKEKLRNLGIDFDYTSSKAIYESIQKICASAENPKAMDAGLNTLLTKPMARAKYFCSEGKTEASDLWHYALSIPIYTHFTSPIRRYPDILVHRLLAACLNYCPPPKRTAEELHHIAKICNEQKFNAKNAGDESTNLFFKRYIKSKQSIIMNAVVVEVFRHMANVVTIDTGHLVAIEYKVQKLVIDTSKLPEFILISEENSKNQPIPLRMFSTVEIKLVIWDGRLSGYFVSPDPKQRQLNSIQSSKKRCQNNAAASNNVPNANNSSRKRRPRHNSKGQVGFEEEPKDMQQKHKDE